MAFEYAGSLSGAAPVVVNLDIGETCYEGQLLQSGIRGGLGGHVQILDAAGEAFENDIIPLGLVVGVVDASRTYDGTYHGNSSTYTTTIATIKANGAPGRVQVVLIRPFDTLLKGPICYTAYGTAPTVLTNTTASTAGTTLTHTSTVTDTADDLATLYMRTGANAGLSRVITTVNTTSQVATIPFPNTIAVGDTGLKVACVLGFGAMNIIATADCIDGDNALSSHWGVYYHEINCQEAGKEYAIFSFLPCSIDSFAS